jgi:hypothetical protein
MKLLPLFLEEGKIYEMPIVVGSCKNLLLHEVIYRSKEEINLITECRIEVNGEMFRFSQAEHGSKNFYPSGEKGKRYSVPIRENGNPSFSLKILCEDFSKCHCRKYKFQLKVSAECDL